MISFTTASPPEKVIVQKKETVCIKPASYKEGRVLVPAIYEEKTFEVAVWRVATTEGDLTEQHEFASQEDADNFYRGFK